MRWIAVLIGGIWRYSCHIWIDVGGLKLYGGASALYFILFLIFFSIGTVLMLLGFNLGDVDRWLDARAGWFDLIGTLAFKGLLVFILLICVLMVGMGLFERLPRKHRISRGKGKPPDESSSDRPLSFGAMIAALIVGYFAYVGIFN